MSNDLGETSTEGKLALSGAPNFTEKIEDQKTGIDAPWKIAAKVTGESRVVSLKFYSFIHSQIKLIFSLLIIALGFTPRIENFTNRHQMFYIQILPYTVFPKIVP